MRKWLGVQLVCLAICVSPVVGLSQELDGAWSFRGFYAEASGGPQTGFDQNFDSGTFDFVNNGGGSYRITVVDQTETQVFDLNLELVGLRKLDHLNG